MRSVVTAASAYSRAVAVHHRIKTEGDCLKCQQDRDKGEGYIDRPFEVARLRNFEEVEAVHPLA